MFNQKQYAVSVKYIGMAQQALLHAENARNVLLAADTAKQQGRQVYDRSDVLPIMELIYLVMGKAQLALKKYVLWV